MKKTSIDKPQELDESLDDGTGRQRDVTDIVTIQVPVQIRRRGHAPVYENGAIVVIESNVMLYGQLEEPFTGPRFSGLNQVKTNLYGVVVDRVWHYSKHTLANQMCAALHRPPSFDDNGNPPLFPEVYVGGNAAVELWYHVMFHEGLFWVRYDWIDRPATEEASKK